MSAALQFGPFTLVVQERRLLRQGAPVELGARAFDILTVLCERANQIVSKQDLLRRVWPDALVDEGSLRFHMSHLRKALGDGRDGARYIATLAGRGYCLVAPVSRSDSRAGSDEIAASHTQANLPSRPHRLVGRAQDAAAVSAQLTATRFVTLAGAGGVGKTTIALGVAYDLIDAFLGCVHFVDLGAVSDPRLVGTTLASVLGLSLEVDDACSGLIDRLANRRDLIVLDTCEHVIEAVAELASRIFSAAPEAHILATSREPLRVEGEHVYKVEPLAYPPEDSEGCGSDVWNYPAIQLFVECAEAVGAGPGRDPASASAIAEICRKLGGMPLAIELAAARVPSFGLAQTASMLGERLALSWPGRRTAPARQRTLQATLDWSYGLLSDLERLVLRRLAVFLGHFSIDSALAVALTPSFDDALAFQAIDGLVAKSMLAARPMGAMMRYRLLDPTRAYALELAIGDAEACDIASRHARVCLQWLRQAGREWQSVSSTTQRSLHVAGLANVRAALDWCFSPNGDGELGVELAVAAAPMFLSMSLLTECHRWSAQAILALAGRDDGGREEMQLQAAQGVSLMFMSGGQETAHDALRRGLRLAEAHGDMLDRIQILAPLQMFYLRAGKFAAALDHAKQCAELAGLIEDPVIAALANSLRGISLHLSGDFDRARTTLEAAVRPASRFAGDTTNYLGFDGGLLAQAILARTLYLQGHPEQAIERASLAIANAEAMNHPLSLSIVLVWAVSIYLYVGDLDSADFHVRRLFARAETHALGPYLLVGRGFQGEIAIRRGDAQEGVALLQHSLAGLRAAPYHLLTTPLSLALVQGLAATRRYAEASALLDETIVSVERQGDLCYMAELLRVRAAVALAAPRPHVGQAETWLADSLDWSRKQGARAWELRAACDLARSLAARGERERACDCLRPVFELFDEGADTSDLQAAADLLATLDCRIDRQIAPSNSV